PSLRSPVIPTRWARRTRIWCSPRSAPTRSSPIWWSRAKSPAIVWSPRVTARPNPWSPRPIERRRPRTGALRSRFWSKIPRRSNPRRQPTDDARLGVHHPQKRPGRRALDTVIAVDHREPSLNRTLDTAKALARPTQRELTDKRAANPLGDHLLDRLD